jgi:hypothetical protein
LGDGSRLLVELSELAGRVAKVHTAVLEARADGGQRAVNLHNLLRSRRPLRAD